MVADLLEVHKKKLASSAKSSALFPAKSFPHYSFHLPLRKGKEGGWEPYTVENLVNWRLLISEHKSMSHQDVQAALVYLD